VHYYYAHAHIMCSLYLSTPHINTLYTQVLIDHVCAFVENNQVQWLDLHSRPMKFNRSAILMEVIISLSCYIFKEKYTAMQESPR